MGSSDLVTNRAMGQHADVSTDPSVEPLTPAGSASAVQGQTPAAEVSRKARRRPRPDQEAELEASAGPGNEAGDETGDEPCEEPKHKIDSLA